MQSILPDLRYALRQLRRSPSFTLTAVAVLALGLGANIAVFTLLNGILLRPLPYAHPDRIVAIELSGPQPYYNFAYADMLQLRDAVGPRLQISAVFDSGGPASVPGPNGRMQVNQSTATAGLFEMLGVKPALGRTFREDENQPGRNRVVMIDDNVWHKLYNADPNVLGKTLTLHQAPYTIIGVLPKGFFFWYYDEMAVWSPEEIVPAARSAMAGNASKPGWMYARLPEGMTAAQLAARLSSTQAIIAREAPNEAIPGAIKVTEYQKLLIKDAGKPLTLLYALVAGIWALACLNVTSLMLARTIARAREQAVRTALGASRRRLLQQAIVESLLISSTGALFGLLLGQTLLKLLWRQIKQSLPLTQAVHVDWRVVTLFVALTLLTAAITGVFPALRAMRRDVRERLSGMATTSSARANLTREALVVTQLALTLVFLVGAGLFLRTIHALRQVPLGFSQQNVLTGGVIMNPAMRQVEDTPATQANVVRDSYEPLLDRIRTMPGVRSAALSSVLPMRPEMSVSIATDIDHKKTPREQTPTADGRLASSGLVETLGIPMIRGRFFTDEDTANSAPVVVVNQAFANKYLPGVDPLGHVVSMGKGRFDSIRIVGVVGDMKQLKLTEATRPEIYFCLAQIEPGSSLYGIATAFIQVAIRSAVPADTLRGQFDKVLHEVAPDSTTTDVKTIHQAVEDSFGSQTLIARLLESFAALALIIATVGLYGLLSFAVAQRTREIGVRLALGAPKSKVLRMVLGRALLLLALGLSSGALLAWFAVSFAQSYIYGVRIHDAMTFLVVLIVLTAASFLAAWLPARRAAGVDPILALRSE